jgi:glycosyltransferase involved in cell wall biosynthesis
MKASICIAAYNKPNHLGMVLQSIFRQKPSFSWEVIVVDDGSPSQEVQDVCKRFPVSYHRIDRAPTYRNPAVARNVAYRLAKGEVFICQSDDVVHQGQDCIERLVNDLKDGTFLLASVYDASADGMSVNQPGREYCSTHRQRPLFFLGSVLRKHVFAIGGNSEDFTAPAYEDYWFGNCLQHHCGLKACYTDDIVGWHLCHPRGPKSATYPSRKLYWHKVAQAKRGREPWTSRDGPWPMT